MVKSPQTYLMWLCELRLFGVDVQRIIQLGSYQRIDIDYPGYVDASRKLQPMRNLK